MGGEPAPAGLASPTRAAPAAGLREVAARARPVALAGQQVLPVGAPLTPLLPAGGLRRGTVVTVAGGPGATSLALALAAGPSGAGSWVAVLGGHDLGLVAAAEMGVALDRLALVPSVPPDQWAVVAAALLDAIDVVLVRPPARVRPVEARRLAARARERGSVLVPVCAAWPEAADVRLAVVAGSWEGLGQGFGHLRRREVTVAAGGRGAAARERRARLWLPDANGAVAAAGVADDARSSPHDRPARSSA